MRDHDVCVSGDFFCGGSPHGDVARADREQLSISRKIGFSRCRGGGAYLGGRGDHSFM